MDLVVWAKLGVHVTVDGKKMAVVPCMLSCKRKRVLSLAMKKKARQPRSAK